MGLLDKYNQDYKRVNPASFVQNVIRCNLGMGLDKILYNTNRFVCFKGVLGSEETILFWPEVVVYDKKETITNEFPVFFIEIEATKRIKACIEKSTLVIRNFNISQAFIFDYEQWKWYKISNDNAIITIAENDSYCGILNIDLSAFLKEKEYYFRVVIS